ncbi:MAG: phosphate acyltransferase PlsX [Gammaproteobacteria bacterium]|nr:phosphate acyltransferase PlsX [Gammaproteobacteria bacterium]
MRIAIDTLGADAGAGVLIDGALDAVAARPDIALNLIGEPESIHQALGGRSDNYSRHTVTPSPRRLDLTDSLRLTLRGALASSMRTAVESVADRSCDALVSAGSTGALMALSRHLVGRAQGVDRPAIVKRLPTASGRPVWLLDLGANLKAGPEQLHQFAHMGAALAESVANVATPRVAMLNIGSEFHKGPANIRAAARLLAKDDAIRDVGYVEAHDLFTGAADVIVAEGFAGNVALKASEGAAQMAAHVLREELRRRRPRVSAATHDPDEQVRAGLSRVFNAYNPQLYNGASLMGLSRVIVKSHGGTDREGFAQAVRTAIEEVEMNVPERIAHCLAGRLA